MSSKEAEPLPPPKVQSAKLVVGGLLILAATIVFSALLLINRKSEVGLLGVVLMILLYAWSLAWLRHPAAPWPVGPRRDDSAGRR